ncbi:MAG: COX15/CtaA family protein [Planctomycetes bacterium]|nr:COX15/CtaA family protein [Planctomycetota bacterium]
MSTSAAIPAAAPGESRGPFRLAMGVIVTTMVVIVFGAMTTSTGSGMAFVDWPLSDGQLMPERSYTTVPGFLEHFHRLIASLAGTLALVLALWLQFGRRATPAARKTAWIGGVVLLMQAVVGGVGVRLELPAVTSVTHGLLAQVTLSIFAWLAYLLSDRYARTAPIDGVPPGTGRRLAIVAVAMLIAQTLLGGIARHTNNSHALWTHAGNSLVVFLVVVIATGFAVGKLGGVPGLRGVARWLATLLILQLVLGFVALIVRNSAGKTPENVANLGTAALISVHVFLGAMLTVLAATLCAHVFRGTRRPE